MNDSHKYICSLYTCSNHHNTTHWAFKHPLFEQYCFGSYSKVMSELDCIFAQLIVAEVATGKIW